MITTECLSDEALMARFSSESGHGDFSELVRRHQGRMFRVAWNMLGHRRDAEDAVQECFMRILGRRRSYHTGTPFSPWAYTILRYFCIDELRKRKGHENEVLEPEILASPDHTDQGVEQREQDRMVQKALLELPEDDREVVSLRIYAEMDFNAISETCKISPDAAKKRFYRSLEKLKNILKHLL